MKLINNEIVIKNNIQQQGHKQGHKKPLPAKHVVALRNPVTGSHLPFFARFTFGSSILMSKTSGDCC
jgi:hypothetical protein